MRRVLAVLLFLVTSKAAFAFRARPVSDLRFDGIASSASMLAASDGKDFLVVSTANSVTDPRAYVQLIVKGKAAGPHVAIGRGIGVGIAWTGSEYLVARSRPDGLWISRISRHGGLIETRSEPAVPGRGGYFAMNGQSAIALSGVDDNTLLAQPLDLTGRPSGRPVTFSPPRDFTLSIGAWANGYAIVATGWQATSLMLIRADGMPLLDEWTTIEGPYQGTSDAYHSSGAKIATNGGEALVVFAGEKHDLDTDLKTVVIGIDGATRIAARSNYRVAGAGPRSLQLAGLVWDGSQYVVAVAVSKDPTGNFTDVDPGLLRVGRDGEIIGDLTYATTGERRQVPTALAWSGSELLMAWYDTTNQQGYGSFCATLDRGTMTASSPARLGRTLGTQSAMTIAAGGSQYLAAWLENADGVVTVRASRLDGAGNYLDHDGIVLANMAPPAPYTGQPIAIDSDDTNWLVVWTDGSVRGKRISRDGAVLDGQPLVIGIGYEPAVRWNGSSYSVLFSDGSLHGTIVTASGVVAPARALAITTVAGATRISYRSPSVAVNRDGVLVAFERHDSGCFTGTPGGCFDSVSIRGLQLDSGGAALDTASFEIARNVWGRVAVAADATRYLVTWSQYTGIFGTVLSSAAPQQGGNAFLIDSNGDWPALAFDGRDFVAAWRARNAPTIVTARVTSDGAISARTIMRTEEGVAAWGAVVAASATMPALLAFLDVHAAYDYVSRGALLFADEWINVGVPVAAPALIDAVRVDIDTVDVRWRPVAGQLGISIELRHWDGTYRAIGVAAGGASGARVSLTGLEGGFIRLRTWNASGPSTPSSDVPILVPRQRAVRGR